MPTHSVEDQRQLDPMRQSRRDEVKTRNSLEHGALLKAIHEVEERLVAAAPGRVRRWADLVLHDLRRLRDIYRQHVESTSRSDGLFCELGLTVPTWIRRMERLQQRQDGLLQQMNSLISQLGNHDGRDVPDFSDIRRRTAAVLDEVRAIQALENDLIFECFQTDLGVED